MTDLPLPQRPAPVSVYLLAEHLDAALAAGEDLTSVLFIWPGPQPREPERIAELRAGQRAAIERIRTFELALLSRVITGRDWAAEVAVSDERFAMMARLYLSGTVICWTPWRNSPTSVPPTSTPVTGCWLCGGRGMIAAEAPALIDTAPLIAGENFLVARRIPLGPLLDLVATFLDTLEAEYDLFVTYKDGGSAFSLPAALLR